LGDLFELLDGVSFRSTLTTSSNALARVSQHPTIESIDNAGNDTGDSINSGISKASSYPSFCASFPQTSPMIKG
jgi:hypothetical protein